MTGPVRTPKTDPCVLASCSSAPHVLPVSAAPKKDGDHRPGTDQGPWRALEGGEARGVCWSAYADASCTRPTHTLTIVILIE